MYRGAGAVGRGHGDGRSIEGGRGADGQRQAKNLLAARCQLRQRPDQHVSLQDRLRIGTEHLGSGGEFVIDPHLLFFEVADDDLVFSALRRRTPTFFHNHSRSVQTHQRAIGWHRRRRHGGCDTDVRPGGFQDARRRQRVAG